MQFMFRSHTWTKGSDSKHTHCASATLMPLCPSMTELTPWLHHRRQSQHVKIHHIFIRSYHVYFLLYMMLRMSGKAKNSPQSGLMQPAFEIGWACVTRRQPDVHWHSVSQQPKACESASFIFGNGLSCVAVNATRPQPLIGSDSRTERQRDKRKLNGRETNDKSKVTVSCHWKTRTRRESWGRRRDGEGYLDHCIFRPPWTPKCSHLSFSLFHTTYYQWIAWGAFHIFKCFILRKKVS